MIPKLTSKDKKILLKDEKTKKTKKEEVNLNAAAPKKKGQGLIVRI